MLPELETTLYHGTIHEITKVDVNNGRPLKDFGRGILNGGIRALTRCLMGKFSFSYEEAYRKLLKTDFFDILNDPKSGLCLEPDWYLCEACLLEIEQGRDAMIRFINDY